MTLEQEYMSILMEAFRSIEQEMALESPGWTNLGASGLRSGFTENERRIAVNQSRLYSSTDPLAKQSIRLWTDYAFGTGMSVSAKEDATAKALDAFWQAPTNRVILSARGQRKSSDKVLIEGEIFFALFLGTQGQATIRTIDPLEITEIITNEEDVEDVRYYKREWSTATTHGRVAYYRSTTNIRNESARDSAGQSVSSTEDALIYHFAHNTITQRGNPLLLPVLDWIKLYRQFLASRAAVMLALARFAWRNKVAGGAAEVATAKATLQGLRPAAGATIIENLGSDMQPIKTDSGAAQAYQDGRMLKLQISAGTGWPEQYFGDISIGNLATAKTVELPVQKMLQSYQAIWAGVYDDIDQVILEHAKISPDKRYVDRDFPAISPEDAGVVAENMAALLPLFPEFGESSEVQQQALIAMGINDTQEVLDALGEMAQESSGNEDVYLAKALRYLRERIKESKNGHQPVL